MNLANKLIQQYKQHGKLIIAFDFDDTVYANSPDVDVSETIKVLQRAKEQGHELICFTCRDDQMIPSQYCFYNRIMYDYFNGSPYNNEETGLGKPYFNVLLDDKAGLEQAREALNHALSIIGVKQKMQK